MPRHQRRQEALKRAREAWSNAPAHIRVMARAYVEPLLAALDAIGAELDEQRERDAALLVALRAIERDARHEADPRKPAADIARVLGDWFAAAEA